MARFRTCSGGSSTISVASYRLFAARNTDSVLMATSRPVEDALDLLGRRWALRLIWELRRSTLTFSELRRRTEISPSVLSARLGELAAAGVLERDAGRRYRLSGRGRELARLLYELNRWAEAAGVSSRSELA
jgi:DNA-binding HxlR family transcriptional regulator